MKSNLDGIQSVNDICCEFEQHLYDRGLNTDINCWINWSTEIVSFPLWSPLGHLIGYQRYSWKEPKIRCNHGKYFTWITEIYKPYGIFGWEYYNRPGPLFIVEGIWDAIRVLNEGYSCFAILTATPERTLKGWLNLVTGNRFKIVLCDNDPTGKKLAKLGNVDYTVPGKDLNDMQPIDVQSFLEEIVSNLNMKGNQYGYGG